VPRESGGHVGRRVDPVDGVDVPGLDGPGVQRSPESEKEDGRQEPREARRGREDQARHQVQHGAGDHDGTTAEDVGEAARGELQHDDHDAVHAEQNPDLGQGQPTGLREEHGDRGREPDGQPAQRGETHQPAGRRVDGDRPAHSGHSFSGTTSMRTLISSAP
jgi:hypothetical protein